MASLTSRYVASFVMMLFVTSAFGLYAVLTNRALTHSTLSPLVYACVRDCIGASALMMAVFTSHLWSAAARPNASSDTSRIELVDTLLAPAEPPLKRVQSRSDVSTWNVIAYEDSGFFVLLAVCGVWGSQGLSAIALKYVTASFFGATNPTQPAVALALALALGMEPFHTSRATSWGKLLGIVIAIGGAVMLVTLTAITNGGFGSIAAGSSNLPFGACICALQVVTTGSFAVAMKRILIRGYRPLVAMAWTYTFGAGILLLCVIVAVNDADDWAWSTDAAGAVVFSGLVASALNYFLLASVNAMTTPVFTSACLCMNAVFTGLFAWLIEGTVVSAGDAALAATIFVGLLIMTVCQMMEQGDAQRKLEQGNEHTAALDNRRYSEMLVNA